jgi:glucosylglycerate synthase
LQGIELRKEIQDHIQTVREADIVVGVPSYNNASTIGHVVMAVQAGLAKYFPGMKAVLINSDGGSTDGTSDVVYQTSPHDFRSILLHHRVEPVLKIAVPYHGIPGKGSAFRTIFHIAEALKAKACAVVDADLRSITPEWVELLIKPVIEMGFDYVAPLYQRHKYDGTITNSIIYPLTRSLYGKRVRQPIGGDFGLSGRLVSFLLNKDVWETDVAKYGIDIWMTTSAIANGFKVCQSFLGAKIHDPKDPGADLSAMLHQVVGATFDLMETYADVWKKTAKSEKVPVFGFEYAVGLEPVSVNLDRMIGKFSLGVRELADVWRKVIPEEILTFLQQTAVVQKNEFSIPDDIWVKIIYSFAAAYHQNSINRTHLLKSLTPLYIGRVASFVSESWESTGSQVEEKIELLCSRFENEKNFLFDNWS